MGRYTTHLRWISSVRLAVENRPSLVTWGIYKFCGNRGEIKIKFLMEIGGICNRLMHHWLRGNGRPCVATLVRVYSKDAGQLWVWTASRVWAVLLTDWPKPGLGPFPALCERFVFGRSAAHGHFDGRGYERLVAEPGRNGVGQVGLQRLVQRPDVRHTNETYHRTALRLLHEIHSRMHVT